MDAFSVAYCVRVMHIDAMTLQEWMDRKGLTDAEMANRVGILSRSQINRIRRGKCRPKLEGAKALAAVTRIPAAKFLTGEAA